MFIGNKSAQVNTKTEKSTSISVQLYSSGAVSQIIRLSKIEEYYKTHCLNNPNLLKSS